MPSKTVAVGTGIRDVARLAGVAPSTVSRVLNGKSDGVRISAATVDRVRSAASALRYHPNAAARSLRTMQTQTIGVIARNLVQPFIAELLGVIYAQCRTRGYHLLIGNAEHSSAEGWILGDILSADRVDGVLVLGDILPANDKREHMDVLIKTHNHVVTVGARPSVAGELSILVDDRQGVCLALEHLVALGHRSIGYVRQSLGPESWEDQQRRDAFRSFLNAHDLPYSAGAEWIIGSRLEAIKEELAALFARPQRPTAVFVNNDATALLLMKAAFMCGIHVPEDLSIVGFDDIPFAALYTPGLTSVRQPIDAMGQHAANAVLDMIAGVKPDDRPAEGESRSDTLYFTPTLVHRESTSRLATHVS